MKFMHLSDLHLGKRVNGFSMLKDQEYILTKIIATLAEEHIDGVLLAGDIYDKAIPPAEAVCLFDGFLTKLAEMQVAVLMISGNHDSAERLAFGSRLLNSRGIYLSPVFDGRIEPVIFQDGYGEVAVYLLPFLKPAMVKHIYPEDDILTYQDGIQAVLERLELDSQRRNILVAHQFVTGAERCASEELSVGGMDNIDGMLFADFDYVALGHIHGPQKIGRETMRYCGTPLKYSFSEANHHKSATIIDLKEKGSLTVTTVPLIPLRELREIRGSYMELTALSFYQNSNREDYLHVILTDEEDIPEVMGKLRAIYPNIMRLDYDNQRTRQDQQVDGVAAVEQKTPLQLFEELYLLQNNQPLSGEQRIFLTAMIERIWEGQR